MSSLTVISHSEVDSYLLCPQRHFYAFGDSTHGQMAGLEPLTFSDALYRGIAGHAGLEAYYKALLEDGSFEEANEACLNSIRMFATRPNPKFDILTDLTQRILPRFFVVAKEMFKEGWRPVAVEKEFRLELPLDGVTYVYPFKPDAIMKDPRGNFWVWDHKFVYNFYSPAEVKLLPQIPKYIGALRALDYPIKGGIYNFLRHREVKDLSKHVRQEEFVPSDARVVNAFRQQIKIMEKIGDLKRGTIEAWYEKNTRVLNGMVCKSCSFKHLCAADLDGQDTTLMRKIEFQGNTYGYSETVVE